MMRFILMRFILLGLSLLSGCVTNTEFTLPEISLPDWWQNTDVVAPVEQTLPPLPKWWLEFKSPSLDALEEAALTNNHDLKAAINRLEQAQAQAEIAGAPLLPSLDLKASHGVSRKASATTGRSILSRSHQLDLSVAYEIDFWGKNQAAREAALANASSSSFDKETIARTLTANVATAWFQVLSMDERVKTAQRNLAIAQETLELSEKLTAFGKNSPLEAAQQRSNVANIAAQLPGLSLQKAQALNNLALLTGVSSSQLKLNLEKLENVAIPIIAANLPAQVIAQRPDIKKAEAALIAAFANVSVAKASLLPSISLTGDRGYSSADLVDILKPSSVFWNLGASLVANIFDNGKARANVELSEAKKRELIENYQTSVLTALKEVEDALATIKFMEEQEEAQARAVKAAQETQNIAAIRYREGFVDNLAALDAMRTLLAAEDALVQTRFSRLNAAIGLYKALGG